MARYCLTLTFLLVTVVQLNDVQAHVWDRGEENCFCLVKREIVPCECNVTSIDAFNNHRLSPLLESMLRHQHFRFYKADMQRPCTFMDTSQGICGLNGCALGTHRNATSDQNAEEVGESNDSPGSSIVYYDLLNNPERFTGYSGTPAVNIWKLIYDQQYVRLDAQTSGTQAVTPASQERKVKLPLLYRMISGLHTSIAVGMTAHRQVTGGNSSFEQPQWGPNFEDFRHRFDLSDRNKLERLENMYFLYVVEMHAVVKASSHLVCRSAKLSYRDGLNQTLSSVHDVLRTFSSRSINETPEFLNEVYELKDVAVAQFNSISRIMDCITCERCRLWAQLQNAGMEAAFRVLVYDESLRRSTDKQTQTPPLELTCDEGIALVNAFGRLSKSIRDLESFRGVEM